MDRLFVALRYLRHRPIAVVSLLGVLVGIGSIVVVDSVMNGFLGLQKEMIRSTEADLEVRVPKELGADPQRLAQVREIITKTEGVRASAAQMSRFAIYKKQGVDLAALREYGGFHITELVGIDAADEAQVTDLQEFLGAEDTEVDSTLRRMSTSAVKVQVVDDPFWFDNQHPFWRERVDPEMINFPLIPVIYSAGLVRQMGLHVGDVVFLASWADKPGPDGKYYPREHPFVVVGSFSTRDTQVDLTRALVPREKLREFAGLETHAHKIVIAVEAGHREDAVRDRLRSALSSQGVGPDYVDTWADRKSVLLRAVENERRIMNVVLFFMIVVAAFNLLVTLFMMVSEKVRDIGVLSSLGCSPSGVAAIFLNCGLIVTLGGLLLGVVLGLLLTWNINPIHDSIRDLTGLSLFNQSIYNFVEIPTVVDYSRIFVFSVATLGCTMFMTLFPSYRAARLDPVEALRRG